MAPVFSHGDLRLYLLSLLDEGPRHGYDIMQALSDRTGGTYTPSAGTVYPRLAKLEEEGLVTKTVDGRKTIYEITDAGRGEARAWLASPVDRPPGTRDELAIKLALAATLPGVDVFELISTQRRASSAHLESLRSATFGGVVVGGPEELAWSLVNESMIFVAEAELRWLDHVEAQLATHSARAMALELDTHRPKRGRPASTRSA